MSRKINQYGTINVSYKVSFNTLKLTDVLKRENGADALRDAALYELNLYGHEPEFKSFEAAKEYAIEMLRVYPSWNCAIIVYKAVSKYSKVLTEDRPYEFVAILSISDVPEKKNGKKSSSQKKK